MRLRRLHYRGAIRAFFQKVFGLQLGSGGRKLWSGVWLVLFVCVRGRELIDLIVLFFGAWCWVLGLWMYFWVIFQFQYLSLWTVVLFRWSRRNKRGRMPKTYQRNINQHKNQHKTICRSILFKFLRWSSRKSKTPFCFFHFEPGQPLLGPSGVASWTRCQCPGRSPRKPKASQLLRRRGGGRLAKTLSGCRLKGWNIRVFLLFLKELSYQKRYFYISLVVFEAFAPRLSMRARRDVHEVPPMLKEGCENNLFVFMHDINKQSPVVQNLDSKRGNQ